MEQTSVTWATLDGNEAVARVAHALSEVIAIYPITPASPMGEHADAWTAAGRKNLWGSVPEVVEMQSEAGAAGVLHGAVQKGALGTTFTASQGLLLMLPNMFKIAGELTPAVLHVSARTLATHALSIFGDHGDVMSARSTGWAMLAANSVQEAHDFALVSHAATLRTRVPFLHFFDGFRTSHEINKIQLLQDSDLRALVSEDDVLAQRMRGMSPDQPSLRGTAQNPDVLFQAREACTPFYEAVPAAVQSLMDDLAARTGRKYSLVEYDGAPDADRVIIMMGSGVGAAHEAVAEMVRRGEKVGVVSVRLYRPFPAEQLVAALPESVKRIVVMDRVKEPGAVGDPLYLDVIAALNEQGRTGIAVYGARYGLSSKEFTPQMVKGVFDEAALPSPRRHMTVGIIDDVSHTSVTPDRDFHVPTTAMQAVFFGIGSDGTVGANKFSIKIIGENTDQYAQGYFVYDSRKAGTPTTSHLRFGPDKIHSTYLVEQADFVACSQFSLLERMKIVELARPGAIFLVNSPFPADEAWFRLPAHVQEQIIEKKLRCYVIDAGRVAREVGLGARTNTVMLPCFFKLSGVIPEEQAMPELKKAIAKTYGKRGAEIVAKNHAAVDRALSELSEMVVPATMPADARQAAAIVPDTAPDFVQRVTAKLLAGDGDLLPVSALPVDGTFPTNTTRFEKRALAVDLPIWDESLCTDCGKCALVCPHAAIRIKVYDPELLSDAPEGFKSKEYKGREYKGQRLTVQVAPDDCTGCTLCVDMCPAVSRTDKNHKSLNMLSAAEHREAERPNWDFFETLPEIDRTTVRTNTVKGSQLLQPLFEFSGACSGCGETPYIKLLTQLYGDRLLIANATGCSSIYGGNLPTAPWAKTPEGRGPAWANSLFEDNAEFGLGIRVTYEWQAATAQRLVEELASVIGADLARDILAADQSDEAGIAAQRARVAQLKERLTSLNGDAGVASRQLLTLADDLVKRSVWIVGGDGWAYDIGFGGLDHVLGSGRNVNILVLDTEVYSNTGGQASKSTPRAAVAKFAASGKSTAKKDLGAVARSYGNVYVAQIALGANEMQTVRAITEAEAWPGPSLIIAYATCTEHGIDMAEAMDHQKYAAASGYWPLYRFSPSPEKSAHPFQLDGKRPSRPVGEFMERESRFAALRRKDPERANQLLELAQADIDERWRYFEQLASEERTLAPNLAAGGEDEAKA